MNSAMMSPCAFPQQRAFSGASVRSRGVSGPAMVSGTTRVLRAASVEDKWIATSLQKCPDAVVPSKQLGELRSSSRTALASLRMPSTRNEEYRYTDISPLLKSSVKPADPLASGVDAAPLMTAGAKGSTVVVVNGVMNASLSNLEGLPQGVYVGGIDGAPEASAAKLGTLSKQRGGPFSVLNGAFTQEVLCVVIPKGVVVEQTLHFIHIASGNNTSEREINAPRLLVDAGTGSSVRLVEEFIGSGDEGYSYFTCSIAEMFLKEKAEVSHCYAQREAASAAHFKGTLVSQATGSHYSLAEASVGASLSRHDLGINQEGEGTQTSMGHFLLCGSNQLHDLHTKLELNHPNGVANQLHKCIVSHATGRGVFDGNVKVNKLAQKTDAGQLSRNLLLVPKATVNVKPNLQIIADDVKCTHGCAVSDLSEEELFYFRARGIDQASARQALVYSFGSEVVAGFKSLPELVTRIEADISRTLKEVDLTASAAAAAAAAAPEPVAA